ncbi:MAG: hypothetical protein R3D55_04885 [Chloroflexota bacterium]
MAAPDLHGEREFDRCLDKLAELHRADQITRSKNQAAAPTSDRPTILNGPVTGGWEFSEV